MQNALKRKKPFTAPGKDTLPNRFLKMLGDPFNEKIARVLEACWKLGYFPERYKSAKIICLRKPNKGSYSQAKVWRPIALLNTIGKLMEAIAATRLSELAEKENLLPEMQMGFRKGRSTEIALFLLTSQVEKIWKEGMVASLLSLDISGAYDRVLPEVLKRILERKGIPDWFVTWTFSFTTQRYTTLCFDDSESTPFPIHCGVPQGSPLSPILFLFYMSELHHTIHTPEKGVSAIGFADDTNLLAFSPSLKSNLLKLRTTHSKCLDWAGRHGMKFAPEKYELLYFSRRRTDNLQLSLRLGEVVLQPKEEVRILGLHYDSKLLWKKHQKIMLQKASKFLSALSRTTFSTWGLSVPLARLVYTAILRSLLSYAVGVWFNPHRKLSNISSLSLFQTKCLKIIGGVFKATPTFLIEGELFLPPLDLYFKYRTAIFLQSFYFLNTSPNSPSLLLSKLFSQISLFVSPLRTSPKSLSTITLGWKAIWLAQLSTNQEQSKKQLQEVFHKEWETRWEVSRQKCSQVWELFCRTPQKENLNIFKDLRKAEASLYLQILSARIGLASFLFRANVPEFSSPLCSCGFGEETAQHITLYCNKFLQQRQQASFLSCEFTTLLQQPTLLKKLLLWFMSLKRLDQFNLAHQLLSEHTPTT